jgi:hypothetical protein
MLRNPAYAGAFVYGRTRLREPPRPGGRPWQSPRPDEEWKIVVRDKYPAYVTWATYEKIQRMLHDNRAEYLRLKSRGIPRDGAALLHGIAWCGECGHKMAVRYKGGSQYVCNHLRTQYGGPECQSLRAAPIDSRVAVAFLEAVAPAEMDAWVHARKAQRQADDALRRAEEQQVERLRYQATLAERQFKRVDPDNRLVAAELERQWEGALIELRRAEEAMARRKAATATEPVAIAPRLRSQVVALGRRLPELWADPTVSRAHRKALLRCLIDKVVMRRAERDRAAVRIVWRGGETTELDVLMPVNALTALPRCAEMEARVCELARRGVDDAEIRRLLIVEGHRSPLCAEDVLLSTVRDIRRRNGIKVVPRQTRWPPIPGFVSVRTAASRLGVSPHWVHGRIRYGAIRTRREPSGRYLFPDTQAAWDAMKQLRKGTIKQVDLTQRRPHSQGHQYA